MIIVPKALIFDFGNVIANFDYNIAFEKIAQLGHPDLTAEHVRRVFVTSGRVAKLESGQMSPKQFLDEAAEDLGIQHVDRAEISRFWADIFTENTLVTSVISRIQSNVRLILGSNTNLIHFEHFKKQFEHVFKGFEAYVLSHDVGYMKPHQRFFKACILAAQCDPQECFYIDDVPEYITAAKTLGIQGITYTKNVDLVHELTTRGITLKPPTTY